MTFKVNYDLTTGDIVSYQEGGTPEDNNCPDGCGTLVFASVFQQMFDYTRITMKVDTEKKELVFINPVMIPKPL
jgi:hypothetical protein